MICLRVNYNLNQDYPATYFESPIPQKGIYHFFELRGQDKHNTPYIFNLTHSGFIPSNSDTTSLIASFNIFKASNPNKIVKSVTFNTKTDLEGTAMKCKAFH